jgi:hypothetical protein
LRALTPRLVNVPLDPAGALQNCTMDSLQILLFWRIHLYGTIRMDMNRHSIRLAGVNSTSYSMRSSP